MKTSIRTKVLPLSVAGILFTGFIMGYVAVKNQKTALNNVYRNEVQMVQKIYNNLEINDIKMLKAAMTDFMTNQEIKNIFLENNREKLFDATKDLYAKHKELDITHFYFHRPDRTNFLRVHSPATFDDMINRTTLKKSQESMSWGTGIELGKTAFALRVVHPYYDGANLIGYLEYGEEIDHFNKIIKEQTADDVVTIVYKSKLDPKGWADLTAKNNERNNYDDMKEFVAINSTDKTFLDKANYCWDENDLKSTKEMGNVYGLFSKGDQKYSCGGFILKDADDNDVGVVVSIKNVTHEEAALATGMTKSITLTVMIIIALSLLILLVINRIIVTPIKRLTDVGNKIGAGEIDTPLPEIKSNDEIKDLSDTMETLVGAIKFLKKK